jgi:hypothetical protein
MESSIAEMEVQLGEQLRLLKLQLEEKQILLEDSRTELGALRMQLCALNQRVDEAEAAKIHAETLLHEECGRASRTLAAHSSDNRAAGELAGGPGPVNTASSVRGEYRFRWLKLLWHVWPINWPAKPFPAGVLPVAAAGLLVLPIGYFLLSQAHTLSTPDTLVRWQGAFELPDAEEEPQRSMSLKKRSADDQDRNKLGGTTPYLVDQKSRPTSVADGRNVGGGEGLPERVVGYVTRRTVALRDQPRYAAKARAQIGPATSVSVLDTQGNWLKVRTRKSGTIGYVRKEYLVRASSTP